MREGDVRAGRGGDLNLLINFYFIFAVVVFYLCSGKIILVRACMHINESGSMSCLLGDKFTDFYVTSTVIYCMYIIICTYICHVYSNKGTKMSIG